MTALIRRPAHEKTPPQLTGPKLNGVLPYPKLGKRSISRQGDVAGEPFAALVRASNDHWSIDVDQNPLEQLVAGYFRRGQSVRDLRFDQLPDPTAVVVVLDNGNEYPHAVEAGQSEILPEWLMKAQVFLISKRATL